MRKVRLSFRLTGTIAVGRSRGNDNVMLWVNIGGAEKLGNRYQYHLKLYKTIQRNLKKIIKGEQLGIQMYVCK